MKKKKPVPKITDSGTTKTPQLCNPDTACVPDKECHPDCDPNPQCSPTVPDLCDPDLCDPDPCDPDLEMEEPGGRSRLRRALPQPRARVVGKKTSEGKRKAARKLHSGK